jgi:hypothetical protein
MAMLLPPLRIDVDAERLEPARVSVHRNYEASVAPLWRVNDLFRIRLLSCGARQASNSCTTPEDTPFEFPCKHWQNAAELAWYFAC